MNPRGLLRSTKLRLVVATTAVLCAFFGEVILCRRVYYGGDIARIYLPQRAALKRALSDGVLPWWTAGLGAGYPLLAEGEVGALYPLNWLLYGLFPIELALNASIVLHYLLAAAGFYAYARSLRLSRGAACLGSAVLALGGFNLAHLSHISILSVAAWMPWMFALTHGLYRAGDRVHWGKALGFALVVGMQFLAGHAQISLLALAALAAYAAFLGWPLGARGSVWRGWALWLGGILLGALLGAPQWLAGLELGGASQRAGGLDPVFFTSYSFHPLLLITFVSPFVLGNPYPHGSVELMSYVGLLPLTLGGVALWRCRRDEKWFHVALALAGLAMALGRWNPAYSYLRRVPLLNLFRVPARYLCWTSFALAVLSAMGLDSLRLLGRSRDRGAIWIPLGLTGLALVLALAGVWTTGEVDGLVARWRYLPLLFVVATLGVVLSAGWKRRGLWTALACVTVLVDLYAYGAVLDGTYNATMPRHEVIREPASLGFLRRDEELCRLYTKEEIVPALSVMRESHYPNLALTHGLASANLYVPLVPRNYGDWLDELTPERLNGLNVKYYLLPQLLPVDAASELYDVHNPFASLPIGVWLRLEPLDLSGLEVESYLSHSARLEDGELAAELVLRDAAGRERVIPLRAGLETAEWAYERDDVLTQIAHAMPQVASTWPASSGFPPRQHVGHTYLARFSFREPFRLAAVMLRPRLPDAFVRVERVRLRQVSGRVRLLSHMVGLGDHSLAYRSEDVVIYRNNDVLPRAYLLPASAVEVGEGGLTTPSALSAEEVIPVEIVRYEDLAATLRASHEGPSYLILADLAYPGWRATVDGLEAPILVADGVFRALALPAGSHEVTLTYRPRFALPWMGF